MNNKKRSVPKNPKAANINKPLKPKVIAPQKIIAPKPIPKPPRTIADQSTLDIANYFGRLITNNFTSTRPVYYSHETGFNCNVCKLNSKKLTYIYKLERSWKEYLTFCLKHYNQLNKINSNLSMDLLYFQTQQISIKEKMIADVSKPLFLRALMLYNIKAFDFSNLTIAKEVFKDVILQIAKCTQIKSVSICSIEMNDEQLAYLADEYIATIHPIKLCIELKRGCIQQNFRCRNACT